MKHLLISHDFLPGLPGGIAFLYHHICQQLGDEIQVLVPKSGKWETFDAIQNYPIHRRAIPTTNGTGRRTVQLKTFFILKAIALAGWQFILYIWHGFRIIRHEQIDCIWLGHLYMAPLGPILSWLTRRPFTIFLHGSELQRYWHIAPIRQLILACLNRAAFLIVNSNFTRQQYLDRGVRVDQNFVQIYPGVDVDRFRPDLDPAPIIQRHNLENRRVILTVSRLIAWKGQDTVIRALPQVLQAVPDAVYLIAGSGPYRETLEQLVANLDLQERVIFAGFVPDEELALYYATANLMVMVSREVELVEDRKGTHPRWPIEGFGMIYVEANAVGRPVVGGRMGATAESIAPDISGLLVDSKNEQEVAEAIIRLLTDTELAHRMGQAGRERAVREFTWQTQAARLQQQLAELLSPQKDL